MRSDEGYDDSTHYETVNTSYPLYKSENVCPDVDNAGWKFWDHEVFGVDITGDTSGGKHETQQSNDFLAYMDGKGGTGPDSIPRLQAYSTYIEHQGFFDDKEPGFHRCRLRGGFAVHGWLHEQQGLVVSSASVVLCQKLVLLHCAIPLL